MWEKVIYVTKLHGDVFIWLDSRHLMVTTIYHHGTVSDTDTDIMAEMSVTDIFWTENVNAH